MISVIIPVFKTPLKLRRRCLDSLKGLECEIIEVDELPLAEARNEGLRKAKGEWVWFVDADDEARSEVVRGIRDRGLGIGGGVDVVIMGVRTRWGRFGKRWETIPPELDGEMSAADLQTLNDNFLFRYAWNKIYRREFLVRNDIRFESGTEPCEDAIFNLKCVKAGARWRSVREVGYVYWKRLGSSLFRYCPTIEKACRRENALWGELGVGGRCRCTEEGFKFQVSGGEVGWSEERIAAKVWDNRWLTGSPEKNPPLKWRARQMALLARRLLRFVGV